MQLALVLERFTLLAHAVAQAIAIGGGADAALPLLKDDDASAMVLRRQGAGFGEHLLPLGLREPGSVASALLHWGALLPWRGAGLSLNGGSQPQHQGCGDQGALPWRDAWHGGET